MKLSIRIANDSSKGKILYHIGNQAPMPRPKSTQYPGGDNWERNYLKEPVSSGVFLTDDPYLVFSQHHIQGKYIYSVFVPFWIIKEAGGLNMFDAAKEIIIPEHLWEFCEILSSKEFDLKLNKSQWGINFERKYDKDSFQKNNISENEAVLILKNNDQKQKILKLNDLLPNVDKNQKLHIFGLLAALKKNHLNHLSSALSENKISKKVFLSLSKNLNDLLSSIANEQISYFDSLEKENKISFREFLKIKSDLLQLAS